MSRNLQHVAPELLTARFSLIIKSVRNGVNKAKNINPALRTFRLKDISICPRHAADENMGSCHLGSYRPDPLWV